MTMKKILTLRKDPELKMQASELCCHGLPFEVKLDEPNEISIKAIEDAINDRNMSGPFDSVSALMEALDA